MKRTLYIIAFRILISLVMLVAFLFGGVPFLIGLVSVAVFGNKPITQLYAILGVSVVFFLSYFTGGIRTQAIKFSFQNNFIVAGGIAEMMCSLVFCFFWAILGCNLLASIAGHFRRCRKSKATKRHCSGDKKTEDESLRIKDC